MNKIILVIVLVVVALLVVVVFSTSPSGITPYLNVSENTTSGTESTGASKDNTSNSPADNAVVVEITSAGFSPANVTVSRGATVRFVNKDAVAHWPASGVHPAHLMCSGFDSLKGLSKGESYEFTFNTAKTCPMHDHLNPALRGSVVVK